MFYNRIIFVPFFLHFPFPFPPSKASHIFFLSLLEIHGLFQNNAVTCIYKDISKCSLLGLYNVACMYVSGMTTWYWITNWCPLFHLPRITAVPLDLALTHQSAIKEIPPRTCPEASLMEVILQLRIPLPWCITLTTKISHRSQHGSTKVWTQPYSTLPSQTVVVEEHYK